MVSSSKSENNLPAGVRKTIQSIKEIVRNHSDADIYNTLKESNMDPNETTQKLLEQGYSFVGYGCLDGVFVDLRLAYLYGLWAGFGSLEIVRGIDI
ncbi:GBF-interacting protein 1-like protein isoform X4 [Tanacetum coccineum]